MNPQEYKHLSEPIVGSSKAPHPFWRWRFHPDPKHHKIILIGVGTVVAILLATVAYMWFSHVSVVSHINTITLKTKQLQPNDSNNQQESATTTPPPSSTSGTPIASSGSGGSSAGGTTSSSSTGACSGAANHVPGGKDGSGTCWPGPGNTGVPAGTTLTAYTGPCTITDSNTVIDSKTINCSDGLGILAANVTIKNSKVNTYILVDTDRPGGINFSLTLQDSEVDGQGALQSAVGGANLTIIRSNLHGGINGSECDPPINFCTIRDSYIHGQTFVNNVDTHLGGFLSDGGTNLTIVHNTIFCDTPVNNVGGGCTGDLNMIPNFAAINGALIEHNLFGASTDLSYCTYGGEKASSPTPHSYNIVYKDNVFQKGSNGICGDYGPVTGFAVGNAGNQWTNNKYTDGTTVNPEN